MYIVYYENGDTFTGGTPRFEGSTEGAETFEDYVIPSTLVRAEMPPFKLVVAILQYDRGGFGEILSNQEYYIWREHHWVGTDLWHVIAYFQDNFDFVDYRGKKKRIKERKTGKWREVDALGFFAAIEDTGFVLLGTAEPPERNMEIMDEVILEMEKNDLPPIPTTSRGFRITGDSRG